MSNHKWDKDNNCIYCGVHRTKKNYTKVVRTYTALINGVWEDLPIYRSGKAWHYGETKFERPECKKQI